jgi:hypothetical protein
MGGAEGRRAGARLVMSSSMAAASRASKCAPRHASVRAANSAVQVHSDSFRLTSSSVSFSSSFCVSGTCRGGWTGGTGVWGDARPYVPHLRDPCRGGRAHGAAAVGEGSRQQAKGGGRDPGSPGPPLTPHLEQLLVAVGSRDLCLEALQLSLQVLQLADHLQRFSRKIMPAMSEGMTTVVRASTPPNLPPSEPRHVQRVVCCGTHSKPAPQCPVASAAVWLSRWRGGGA